MQKCNYNDACSIRYNCKESKRDISQTQENTDKEIEILTKNKITKRTQAARAQSSVTEQRTRPLLPWCEKQSRTKLRRFRDNANGKYTVDRKYVLEFFSRHNLASRHDISEPVSHRGDRKNGAEYNVQCTKG